MSSTTDISRKTLLEQLEAKSAEANGIAADWKTEGSKLVMSSESYKSYKAAVSEAQELKSALDAMDGLAQIDTFLQEDPHGPGSAAADAAARRPGGQAPSPMEGKSLGELFVESDALKNARAGGFNQSPHIYAEFEGKSIFNMTGGTVTLPSLGSAQNVGIQEMQRRKMHIRDLFPKSTTRATILYGLRETGWVNNAGQVKQRYANDARDPATGSTSDVFGKARRSRLMLTPVTIPVVEVAHLIDSHKNVLSDDGRLKTFVNTRMVEGVKYAEDYDLLFSVGDAESMTGLFNTPGVQTYTGVSSDKFSVQVRRAITRAMLAEYEPTGLVVSPTQFEQIEVEEDTTGAFRVAVSVAIGAEKRVWRQSIVETTAMPDENFLLGSFGLGAQLHDRETVSVKVSSENSDNFERGVITFRADERVALEVPRPESFVIGTWTDFVAP